MFTSLLLKCCLSLSLKQISVTRPEDLSARSIIRVWHHLHVERLVTHDFTQLLAPTSEKRIYHAAVCHDDIRAISVAKIIKDNGLQMIGIAYAPGEDETASALIAELADSVDTKNMPARWRYEAAFARKMNESALNRSSTLRLS